MSDYDYGISDGEDAVESDDDDDDVLEFVASSKKRKFAYTTFENDDNHKRKPKSGRNAAIYGSFFDSEDDDDFYTKRRRLASEDPPSAAPQFVKSVAPPPQQLEKEETIKEQPKNQESEAIKQEQTDGLQENDTNSRRENQLRKQQEAANARFLALLGRGRGKNKRSRPHHQEEKPTLEKPTQPMPPPAHTEEPSSGKDVVKTIPQDSLTHDDDPPELGLGAAAGLGFASSSQHHKTQETAPPELGGLGAEMSPTMAASFGLGGSGGKPQKSRIDPNLGKWEKHTKGIGMKLLTKMGYKGSGGLGAKRRRKPAAKDDGKVAVVVEEETKPSKAKGISRPVQVVVRPANLGLGFGNFKEATKLKVNQQIEAEVRGLEVPEKKKSKLDDGTVSSFSALPSTKEVLRQQSWKRGARHASAAARKRQRRTVVPYTQVLEKQPQTPVVIDMRGPPSATSQDHEKTKEPPLLAEELLHNVTLLLNTYENKLYSTSHYVQSIKQKQQSLQSDIDDMKQQKQQGQERISKLQTVLRIMDQIEELLQKSDALEDFGDDDSTAKKVQTLVEELGETFTAEERSTLKFYGVLAPSLIAPVVQSRLQTWDPLTDDPATSERLITSILTLCGAKDNRGSSMEEDEMRMKCSMFEKYVLPRVKLAMQSSKWVPMHNVDTVLELYEAVLRAAEIVSPPKNDEEQDENHVLMTTGYDKESTNLSDVVKEELIHDTVYPKLLRALSQWKPHLDEPGQQLEDRLDLWILPWLPHLDRRAIIPTLLSDAKRKLRSALSYLQRTTLDDETFFNVCIQTLKPWKNILKSETLHDLTSQSVTARLGRYLARMKLSREASNENWTAVSLPSRLYGLGLLSNREFLSLVEGELLPNWAGTLHAWLSSSEEISKSAVAEYYREWKTQLLHTQNGGLSQQSTPPLPCMLLREDLMICRFFYGGLVMMQAAWKSDEDMLDELRPTPSNYRVVMARRGKEERARAEEELRKMDFGVVGEEADRNAFVSHAAKMEATATFRDVVEDFAREREVAFRPRIGANSTKDGKPVFLFGAVPIYFESNVVFALHESKWQPVSLDQLVAIATS